MIEILLIVALFILVVVSIILAAKNKLDYSNTCIIWALTFFLLFVSFAAESVDSLSGYGGYTLPDYVPTLYGIAEGGFAIFLLILTVVFFIKLFKGV